MSCDPELLLRVSPIKAPASTLKPSGGFSGACLDQVEVPAVWSTNKPLAGSPMLPAPLLLWVQCPSPSPIWIPTSPKAAPWLFSSENWDSTPKRQLQLCWARVRPQREGKRSSSFLFKVYFQGPILGSNKLLNLGFSTSRHVSESSGF